MMKIREFFTSPFSAVQPAVPTAACVNLPALTDGDPEPVFVTLAVAELDRVSRNGLLYDDALLDNLAQTVPGKWGIFGHIPEREADSAFPKPEVYWVGALREGPLVWAKGYVPPGPARDAVKRLTAAGSGIATSIYGLGRTEQVTERAYRLVEFQLQQLDFAPADRAALQLENKPVLTKEFDMSDTPDQIHADRQTPRIAELEALQQQIAERQARIAELEARVEEMRARAEQAEQQVAELRAQIWERTVRDFVTQKLNLPVRTDEAQRQLGVLTEMLCEALKNEQPDNLENAYQHLWRTRFQVLAEAVIRSAMGPNAVVSPAGRADDWRSKLVEEALKKVRSS